MKLLEDLEGYFSAQLNSFKMLFTLIKLEAKLAGIAVVPLIITLFMLFVILITSWASLTVLVGYFIFIQFHSFGLAIGSTMLLNLLVLCILLKYFIQNLKQVEGIM